MNDVAHAWVEAVMQHGTDDTFACRGSRPGRLAGRRIVETLASIVEADGYIPRHTSRQLAEAANVGHRRTSAVRRQLIRHGWLTVVEESSDGAGIGLVIAIPEGVAEQVDSSTQGKAA